MKPAPVKACTPATSVTSENNDDANDGRDTSQREAVTSRWWRIHYQDRKPMEVVYSPLATQAQILEWEPEAIKVEPFEPVRQKPDEPLTVEQEVLVRAWLRHIGETDEDMIRDALDQCNTDAAARRSYLEAADKLRTMGGY
ncbi:hypothetical protein [Nitrosospira multiformis]|uniref:hypothetical protein n=1 Tax=Nitrosospira multiformis TaxID=1231 RepID=UPI001160317B|nr:hypothetical protein [Nitrosospira multiformis]